MRTVFALLLSLSCCFGQLDNFDPFFVAAVFKPAAVVGGGGTLLSTESFEGTTAPWLCGDLLWGINDHTLRGFTNTTIWSYNGSKALWVTNSTTFSYLTNQLTAADTNCVSFQWIVHASASGQFNFTLSRLGGGDDFILLPKSAGNVWSVTHGSVNHDAGTTWTVGRTNRIWIEWVKGSGANGLINMWVSETSNTFPGGAAPISYSDGNGTSQPTVMTWQCNTSDSGFIDYIRVWDSRPSNWDF